MRVFRGDSGAGCTTEPSAPQVFGPLRGVPRDGASHGFLQRLSAITTFTQSALASGGPAGSTVLTTGDFDNDSFDDMVVGVPTEDIRSERNEALRNEPDVGITQVLYGREGGLSAERTQLFHRDLFVDGDRVLGDFAHSDWFGSAVATGDFDGDRASKGLPTNVKKSIFSAGNWPWVTLAVPLMMTWQ